MLSAMKKHGLQVRIVFLAMLLAGAPLLAQQAALPESLANRIDGIVREQMEMHHIPGLSIAIAEHGQIVFSRGYGFADLENQMKATPETEFRTGSIAKPMTATVAMKLWQEGKLDLDAPVQKYCPAFPRKPWPVTTRELLGHLGGIRHYVDKPGAEPEILSAVHYAHIVDSFPIFANDPLVAEPGTKFEYSTYGYNVVGCVIEGASGETFMEALQQDVLGPAHMRETKRDDVFAIIPHRSRWYSPKPGGGIENAHMVDTSNKVPGGGLLSTSDDLARFAIATMSGELVNDKTRGLMWTEQKTLAGKETGYGLGWSIRNDNGEREIVHTGGQPGASTILYMVPGRGIALAVMTNVDASGLFPLTHEVIPLLEAVEKK